MSVTRQRQETNYRTKDTGLYLFTVKQTNRKKYHQKQHGDGHHITQS